MRLTASAIFFPELVMLNVWREVIKNSTVDNRVTTDTGLYGVLRNPVVKPEFLAWHVTPKGEKSYWNKVGAAWTHRDEEGYTLLHGHALYGRQPIR